MKQNLKIGAETIFVKKRCPFKGCIYYDGCDFEPCYIKDEYILNFLLKGIKVLK